MAEPGAQSDESPALADLVRRLRQRALLSQEELATRSGLSISTIRGLEAGRIAHPRIASVRQLADALRLADADLDRLVAVARGEPTHDQATAAGASPVPAQLPAAVAGFAGRADALAKLDQMLAAGGSAPVVVSAIDGIGGIGKTAIAVYWAHRVAPHFPDGVLYVNLRGFDRDESPLAPAVAVRGFLDALDVPHPRIPATLDTMASLYRSLLAGRRMLVLLDNARDADQVRPLLPGAPGCLVLVTSRNQLASLAIAEGARLLTIDALSDPEARQLLANRLGSDRIAAEPDAVETIIGRCGGLPLALAIVAARPATRPAVKLAQFADQLRLAASTLDALHGPDPTTDPRTVLSWSYRELDPDAARLFRLLGLHSGLAISTAAAASLAGQPRDETRRLLDELVRASLLTETAPGRYTCHDLLRAYGAERAEADDTDRDRRAALNRLLDHYTHTGHAANRMLAPHSDPIAIPLARPAPGTTVDTLADDRHALAWLETEHPVLLDAIRLAVDTGFPAHAWQLAWGLNTFLALRGYWHQAAAVWDTALNAAHCLGDLPAQAIAHRRLANAETWLGNHDAADRHCHANVDLCARVGDRIGQAHAQHGLAFLRERQGRPDQALHHGQLALALFRDTGHQRGTTRSLNAVGWYYALLDDHSQALNYCQQAVTLSRHIGDRKGEAAAWDSLGYAHHHLGQHTQAIDCYSHAIALCRTLDERYNQAVTLAHLGDTHSAAGESQSACEAWTEAFEILSELEHPAADRVKAKLDGSRQE